MRRATLSLVVIALLATLTACSGGSNGGQHTSAAPSGSTAGAASSGSSETAADRLLRSARTAIGDHHRLSVRVLWTNTVPPHPTAIAGSALANLRESAATRRRRGIRVRLLSERFRILNLRLDPSYSVATATILDTQQVRPYGRDGQPLGRPVKLVERARLDLRRVGSSARFVVWKAVALR